MLILEAIDLLLREKVKHAERLFAENAALLVELAVLRRIRVDGEELARMRLVDPSPTGNELLDRALQILSGRDGARLVSLVKWRKLRPVCAGSEPEPGMELHIRRRLVAVLQHRLHASDEDLAILTILSGWGISAYTLELPLPYPTEPSARRLIDAVFRGATPAPHIEAILRAAGAALAQLRPYETRLERPTSTITTVDPVWPDREERRSPMSST